MPEFDFNFDYDTFILEINELRFHDVSLVEAITFWCDKNNIEIETIVTIIKKDPILKFQLLEDAKALNFIKKNK